MVIPYTFYSTFHILHQAENLAAFSFHLMLVITSIIDEEPMELDIPAPPPEKELAVEDYAEGVYVVVKFTVAGKDSVKLFVGKTLGYVDGLIDIKFLKQCQNSPYIYTWPDVPDISSVEPSAIIGQLNDPEQLRREQMKFPVELSDFLSN